MSMPVLPEERGVVRHVLLVSGGLSAIIRVKVAGSVRRLKIGRILMFEGLLQPQHLLLILAVAVIFFGPKKLPELGQGLGKGIRSFRESMKAVTEEPEKTEPASPATAPERK